MKTSGRWRKRVQRVLYEGKIGSKWKGKKKKKQRERENKEPWRLCLLAQSAIIPPPLPALTSHSGPASLYGARTQVSIQHTLTSYVKVDLFLFIIFAPSSRHDCV